MKLTCLSTGSQQGNCYLLEHDVEVLILDCGIPIKAIKQGLNWDISKVVGCCVTHGHLDHAKSEKDIADMGINVCTPYIGVFGQIERMHATYGKFEVNAFALTDTKGNFKHTNSDGSECPCYGFLISHPYMGRLLYITDTELVKWRFKNINHILISCNYQKKFLEDENNGKRSHVLRGHMELETVKSFIEANKSDSLKTVTLCHLSAENADAEEMIAEVNKVTGNSVTVDYAAAGKRWDLRDDDCPF